MLTDAGTNLPFNVRDRSVEFFAGEAARVRVIAGNSERVYSLTLPEMWDVKWTPPANVRHGIPAWNDALRRNRDCGRGWPRSGAALLIGEWIAYGRYSAVAAARREAELWSVPHDFRTRLGSCSCCCCRWRGWRGNGVGSLATRRCC